MNQNSAPQLPRPITMLVNGHSRRGRELFHDARAAVRAADIPLGEALLVQSRTQTRRVLQREIADGAQTVIIGGGDGTLSLCAGILAGSGVAMGVLPLGTGNTLARSLAIPADLPRAAQTIAGGHIETMDVGRVNGRVFVNSVSLGISAEIAHALDHQTKRRLGLLAWPLIGFRTLWTHRALRLKIVSAEQSFAARTHQLVISNGRYVAGPIAAAPDASVQDSCLRVFVLGGSRLGSLGRAMLQWISGRRLVSPQSRAFTTGRVRVESRQRRVRADVDGEINESTPLEIEIVPRALRVIVPRDFQADKA